MAGDFEKCEFCGHSVVATLYDPCCEKQERKWLDSVGKARFCGRCNRCADHCRCDKHLKEYTGRGKKEWCDHISHQVAPALMALSSAEYIERLKAAGMA